MNSKIFKQALPWIIFVTTLLYMIIFVQGFFRFYNLTTVFVTIAFIAIPAIGLAIIMLSGSFDLSFVGVIGVCSVMSIKLFDAGIPTPVILFLTLIIAIVAELINGFFIIKLKIHPWLTTIATMLTYLGLEKSLSEGYNLSICSSFYQYIRFGKIFGLPVILNILILVTVVFIVLLHKTPLGTKMYAVGGNPEAALKAGINKPLVQYIAFALMGLLSWVSSIVYTGQLSGYPSESAYHNQLEVILAVFFGMAISRKNIKNVPGAVIGAAYVALLANGLGLAGVSAYWIKLIEGCLVIVVILGNSIGRKEIVQLD